MSTLQTFRWAGIAGIVASVAWAIGDILLVGNHSSAQNYPLLLVQYANQIDTTVAAVTLGSSNSRLMTGALLGPLAIPLFLIACWHLYAAARPAGRGFAVPALVLLFVGHAWAPLGHAGFYFVAAAYKAILIAPADAHPVLLNLAHEFHRALNIMYAAAVGSLVLGLLWLIAAMATGRTAWPRWMAVATPAIVVAVVVGHHLLPTPLGNWVGAAGINISWLLIFSLSTTLCWNWQPRQGTA